ncbi:hypothetical protein pb186bvf_019259 [Paramecium bursaria]
MKIQILDKKINKKSLPKIFIDIYIIISFLFLLQQNHQFAKIQHEPLESSLRNIFMNNKTIFKCQNKSFRFNG